MIFEFESVPSWPPLAWLAACEPGSGSVRVRHGPAVEVRADWFCEAVWDGPFAEGGFDRTDRVFGSGGRVREEGAVFVSSATTVDRLCHIETGGVALVSNSLACLAARAGVDFDPTDPTPLAVMESAAQGIGGYRAQLPCRGGAIALTLHGDLHWDGRCLRERPKPDPRRDFSSFERYRAFLRESLAALAANLRAPERARPLEPISTASSGYDSCAVTVLAAESGLREVITIGRSRYDRDDSGLFLIEHLGLEPVLVERSPECTRPFTIVPFLVGDAVGRDVFLAGAETKLAGRVLFSGYHGDTVWGLREWFGPERARDLCRRGGNSGLSLSEYRLWAGFVHCPVPYLGARDVAQLRALSNSESMGPWARGGDYARPLPRRIVEEAGVPPDRFGVSKKVAGLLPSYRPDLELLQRRDPVAAADLRRWLRQREGQWWRRGRLPPLRADALEAFAVSLMRLGWRLVAPLFERDAAARRYRLATLLARLPATRVSRALFAWAISRAAARYAVSPQRPGDAGAWPQPRRFDSHVRGRSGAGSRR